MPKERDSAITDVHDLLRALAEVRDEEFYPLYVRLSYICPRPNYPHIGFRIYRSDPNGAWLVVWVDAMRSDGNEVNWHVGVQTDQDRLQVLGGISFCDDIGSHDLFEVGSEVENGTAAALLVREYAKQITAQFHWFESELEFEPDTSAEL